MKKRLTRKEYCKILDEANAVKLYTEDGWTQTKIAETFNVPHSSVSIYFQLREIDTKEIRKRNVRKTYSKGTKFGLWTIISDEVRVDNKRQLMQLCQCCCGNQQWIPLSKLRRGSTTRCLSCARKKFITEEGTIDIKSIMETLHSRIILGLKDRKKLQAMEFNITPEYLVELYEKQNRKCAVSGQSIDIDISKPIMQQKLSLDRIDSSKGYIKGNVQWVIKDLNMMKQAYSNEHFKEMCCEVAEQNGYSKCQ